MDVVKDEEIGEKMVVGIGVDTVEENRYVLEINNCQNDLKHYSTPNDPRKRTINDEG